MRFVLVLAAILLAALAAATSARADPIAIGAEHCVVNVRADDVLNLRTGPGAGHHAQAGLRYGECGIVVVAACRGLWCPVENGHHAGWVHRQFLAMVSPAMYCVVGVARWDVLNLRAFPSATSRIIVGLRPRACGIAFLPYAVGDWQKVRVDGREGWVNRSYLSAQ
jgi:SH3-like domain-containing protein